VRRDLLDVAEAVRGHLGLPNDRSTMNGIVQTIAAMIVPFPDTVDRLAVGEATPAGYRQFVLGCAGDVASRDDLLDAVLADVRSVVSG
jgi:hypothetical protein